MRDFANPAEVDLLVHGDWGAARHQMRGRLALKDLNLSRVLVVCPHSPNLHGEGRGAGASQQSET